MNGQPMASEGRGFQGPEGVKRKLREGVDRLTDSSVQLRKAITNRKPQKIWEILGEQERVINEVERQTYLWSKLFGTNGEGGAPDKELLNIKSDIVKLRRLGDGNAALAKSFLNAVRKALSDTGTKIANTQSGKNKVYGRSGRMFQKRSSLLVNQTG